VRKGCDEEGRGRTEREKEMLSLVEQRREGREGKRHTGVLSRRRNVLISELHTVRASLETLSCATISCLSAA
jgi:hypothetical protein